VDAYQNHDPRQVELLMTLGARVLTSAAALLRVEPVSLGWALADGQLATLLDGGEPHVPGDLVERRVEVAIACVAAWAELEAERIRVGAGRQADRLTDLARIIRNDYGGLQRTLYLEATRNPLPATQVVIEASGSGG
jgi:hypothetical protein